MQAGELFRNVQLVRHDDHFLKEAVLVEVAPHVGQHGGKAFAHLFEAGGLYLGGALLDGGDPRGHAAEAGLKVGGKGLRFHFAGIVPVREGGFKAQCVCKYVGIPSAMEVDLSDATIVTDTDWNVDVVEVGGDKTTSYHAINLSNIFGEPGAEFTPEYDIVLEAHGGIKTQNTTYDASGNLTGTEQGELTLQTMDFFDTAGYYSAYFAGTAIVNQVFVGIRDGQLYISGQGYPAAYSTEKKNTDSTVSKAVFDGYIDDMEPYVTVILTEKTTGITYTFNVRTVGTVNNVNLDYNEIIF